MLRFIMNVCRYVSNCGMFCFCVADSEYDLREGSEQYQFIDLFSSSRAWIFL
ncbi:putative phosphodiesterase I [Lupinus albus]|uniref:Putative phosphodiesterase I n=1 Tax=Lupinus albus TaxID=3870 RepID=A0A6A4PDQ3_LUPAL|nr:putative phosphodiesterase I [Lupinus albus]KAE9598678.1 putative phosphodiesterase I [Lupinus albus]